MNKIITFLLLLVLICLMCSCLSQNNTIETFPHYLPVQNQTNFVQSYDDELDKNSVNMGEIYKPKPREYGKSFQVHFYDFDKTITTKSLYNIMKARNSSKCVHSLYQCGLLIDVFGGEYRISQLREYFRALKDKGIKIFIVSHNYANVILAALKLVYLSEYFDGIYGIDNTDMKKTETKLDVIKKIMTKLKRPLSQGIFIDDHKGNINLVKPHMFTYHITDKVRGMNIKDMNKILDY